VHLYITGAGVSSESGIPTFRGNDGFWTIGSKNYTPQEMATRRMFIENPGQFLVWYYKRFVKYRKFEPNLVHYFLANKSLITQNIDGLDNKAGNNNYIAIHGNLNKITLFHDEGDEVEIIDGPWDLIEKDCPDPNEINKLQKILLDYFKISNKTLKPEKMKSLKPFVLLFDEFYTNIYKMNLAESWMKKAKKIIFLGTSFTVNITSIALNYALKSNATIEIVDPNPVDLGIKNAKYFKLKASEYVKLMGN